VLCRIKGLICCKARFSVKGKREETNINRTEKKKKKASVEGIHCFFNG